MYYKKGEIQAILKRYKNKYGNVYFANKEAGFYFFGSNQFWNGVNKFSSNGDFLIKSENNRDFLPFGKWVKQNDNSYFISIVLNGKQYGFVGINFENEIHIYWAETDNRLKKITIKDNPF